jgi:hypothetical protein
MLESCKNPEALQVKRIFGKSHYIANVYIILNLYWTKLEQYLLTAVTICNLISHFLIFTHVQTASHWCWTSCDETVKRQDVLIFKKS